MWKTLQGSATGIGHLQNGESCQDSARLHQFGRRVLLAVADGAGHAQYECAAEAAALATEAAIAVAKLQLHRGAVTALFAHRAMIEVFAGARRRLQARADSQGVDLRHFATTLTVVCAFDDVLLLGQVGDSPAVVEYADGSLALLTPPRRDGRAANETHFINDDLFLRHLHSGRRVEPIQSVAVFTDGLDVAALSKGHTPHPGFFTPLFKWAAMADETEKSRRLNDFLRRDDIQSLSYDDMTIVIATRRAP